MRHPARYFSRRLPFPVKTGDRKTRPAAFRPRARLIQMYPTARTTYSHAVRVKADRKVVSITVLLLSVPS